MRISNFLTPPYSSSSLDLGGRGLLWLNEIHHTYIGLFSALNHIFFFVITCVYEEVFCLQITLLLAEHQSLLGPNVLHQYFCRAGVPKNTYAPKCVKKIINYFTLSGIMRLLSVAPVLVFCFYLIAVQKNLICATLAFYWYTVCLW